MRLRRNLALNFLISLVIILLALLFPAWAVEEGEVGGGEYRYIGMAISTGLSCLGASYAVAVTGSAAIASVTERPELFGRTIVYVGMAEGIAIYGLLVSFLIWIG